MFTQLINSRSIYCSVFFLLFAFGTAGCFGGGENETTEESIAEKIQKELKENLSEEEAENLEEGLENLGNVLENLGNTLKEGGAVEPVDFRKLRDLLPDEIDDMERTDRNGEKSGALGIKISKAEATYDDGDGARLTLTITDMGTLKGAAMLGYGWLLAEIDRESDDGFENTKKYKGYPAHRKFERRSDDRVQSNMEVVVAERFIIAAEGNVEMDRIEAAIDAVDDDELNDMKDEGVSEAE